MQKTPPSSHERWSAESDGAGIVQIDIPADLRRERRFEIACACVVACPREGQPWHALKIYVDGSLEWSRRIATSNPGSTDTLDYRFRRVLPEGRPLRVLAVAETGGSVVRHVSIEAEEES